jgi:hypothetical protein
MKQFLYPFNTFSISKSKRISPTFHSFRVENAAFKWRGQFIEVNLQGHFPHVSHSGMAQPHGQRGGVIFLLQCTDCIQSPLLGLPQQPKNFIGRLEADPSCSVTSVSLRLATAGI